VSLCAILTPVGVILARGQREEDTWSPYKIRATSETIIQSEDRTKASIKRNIPYKALSGSPQDARRIVDLWYGMPAERLAVGILRGRK